MRVNKTQKAMSFRIDLKLLPLLEQYCQANDVKKNRAINEAIAKMVGATV